MFTGRVTFARRAGLPGLAAAAVAAAMILAAGCGSSHHATATAGKPVKLPPDYVPIAVGRGPGYQPGPWSARVRAGRPVDGLTCAQATVSRFGAHLEIFARNHVVAIPAGIGTRPPVTRENGRVTAGRCRYPLITADPTGVLEIATGAKLTLGQLFDLWGQPLSRRTRRVVQRPTRRRLSQPHALDGRPARDPAVTTRARRARGRERRAPAPRLPVPAGALSDGAGGKRLAVAPIPPAVPH